tara:strand:- start:2270 stop:3109 length:840 start_codon:yes stop_codon:yes gene_type:complete
MSLKKIYIEHLDSFLILEQSSDSYYKSYIQPRGSFRKLLYREADDLQFALDKINAINFESLKKHNDLDSIIWGDAQEHQKYGSKLTLLYHQFLQKSQEVVTAVLNFTPLFNAAACLFTSFFPAPLDDKQRYKLYDIEMFWGGFRKVDKKSFSNQEEAMKIAKNVCDYYYVSTPEIELKQNFFNPFSDYYAEPQKIVMRSKSHRLLLHEIAHHVYFEKVKQKGYNANGTTHGPEFVKLLADVYTRFLGVDRQKLTQRLNKAQLLGPTKENVSQIISRNII